MSSRKSLLSLTIIYTIGNLSSKLISFFLVFFTTFYLSREDVGQFDLILITVNLFVPLISIQLSDAVLRWLLDKKVTELSYTRTISTIFYFLVFSASIFTIIYQTYNYFFYSEYAVYLNIILVLQLFYIFFQQTIRGLAYNRLYASNSVINAFVYVSLAIVFIVVFRLKVEALLIANIIALSVTSIQLVYRAKLKNFIYYRLFNMKHLKELLSYSFPLMPNSLSWWGISSANRYLILFYMGTGANGIFAVSYKIPTIMVMFLGIFSLAWQEKSILTFDSKNRDLYYTNVFEKYLRVIFSISFLIIASNRLVMQYLVSPAFFEAYKYTPILILGTMFSSLAGFYGTGYLGAKKTRSLLTSSIIGGLIAILFSFLLIPKYNLYGASVSILIGYLFLFIVRVIQAKNFFRIEIPYISFIYYVFIYLLLTTIGYLDNIFLSYLNILFAALIVFFLNKELIIASIGKISFIIKNKMQEN